MGTLHENKNVSAHKSDWMGSPQLTAKSCGKCIFFQATQRKSNACQNLAPLRQRIKYNTVKQFTQTPNKYFTYTVINIRNIGKLPQKGA